MCKIGMLLKTLAATSRSNLFITSFNNNYMNEIKSQFVGCPKLIHKFYVINICSVLFCSY